MIGRLNHVGVAVPSIEAAKATYRDLYGVPESAITETRELSTQGVKFAFVNIANSQIELIEPLGDNSPIAKFIEKNPRGGQHHICFEVEDIDEALAELKLKGIPLLDQVPRIGHAGCRIAFIDPSATENCLIELAQLPAGGAHT
jgi:methylmalonyl-CoA/ethylmalonyl-CoA epimerase